MSHEFLPGRAEIAHDRPEKGRGPGSIQFLKYHYAAPPLERWGSVPLSGYGEKAVHPVAAWRKFRHSEHRDLFERSFSLRQSFLDSIGLNRCPPEVALPLGVPWNLAVLAQAQKGDKLVGTRLGASNSMLVNTIHVCGFISANQDHL